MKFAYSTLLLACSLVLAGCAAPTSPTASVVSLRSAVQKQAWQGGKGLVLTSEHYRIYTTATDEGIPEFLPGFLEQAHQYYRQLTGLNENKSLPPAKVYMLATRNEWADITRKVVKEDPSQYLAISAGGYCYHGTCVFWDIGYMQTLPVAAHEALHQFLMANLRDQLPMWTEEGLCVMVESFTVAGRDVRFTPDSPSEHLYDLRVAITRNHWVGLGKLLSMDAGDAIAGNNEQAVSYYAQLWALIRYIRSNPAYKAGLERLIADAGAGSLRSALGVNYFTWLSLKSDGRKYNRALSEQAFRHYITNDLATFEQGFAAYSRDLIKNR